MWIDPTTGYIAKLHQDIRAARPDWAAPWDITEEMIGLVGFMPVTQSPPVLDSATQIAVETAPQLIDGVWTQAWEVHPRFASPDAEAEHNSVVLAQRKKDLHATVSTKRQSVQEQGFSFTFPDGDGTIQTRNDRDLGNITGQTLAAIVLQTQGISDPVLSFRDSENNTHVLTPIQAIQMGMAVSQFVSSVYASKWAHDEAVEVWDGSTPYDLNTGW